MNKRYNETMLELAGVSCVAYLVKVKNTRTGKECFSPKISRVKQEKNFQIKSKHE